MLWFWDYQKALFCSKMSTFWIGISIPWEIKEISTFPHQLMTKKKQLRFPKRLKKLTKFFSALHSESCKIICKTELFSFLTSNQSTKKAAVLHIAWFEAASSVQNRNRSESSVFSSRDLPTCLTTLLVEQTTWGWGHLWLPTSNLPCEGR